MTRDEILTGMALQADKIEHPHPLLTGVRWTAMIGEDGFHDGIGGEAIHQGQYYRNAYAMPKQYCMDQALNAQQQFNDFLWKHVPA